MNDSETGRESRSLLGHALRGLFSAGLVDELMVASRKLASVDGFPEGWHGVRRTLHYDKPDFPESVLSKLTLLESELAPKDLKKIIQAKILARGSYDIELDDDTESISVLLERARDQAQDLGKALAADEKLLFSMIPEFLQENTTGNMGDFGLGVGQHFKSIANILELAKEYIRDAKHNTLNLIFIRGLIAGWHKVKPAEVAVFLDQAVEDEVWAAWFPGLQFSLSLDDVAYSRLLKSLVFGKASIWQFTNLSHGRATDPLSIEQIGRLINTIATKPDGGLSVSIDVLHMVIYASKEKSEEYRTELAKYCVIFLQGFEWSKLDHDNHNIVNHLSTVISFALKLAASESEVSTILNNLTGFALSERRGYAYRQGELLKPFFKIFPKVTLDSVFVSDDDGYFRSVLRLISTWSSDREETAISKVPIEAFIEWCDVSPNDRYLFAANTCKLFIKSTKDSEDHFVLSDIAKHIFVKANDKKAIVEIFISRFMPNGWSGSLATILRKRLPLLDELSLSDNQEIKDIVENEKNKFIKRIEIEEQREEAEERDRTGSFE